MGNVFLIRDAALIQLQARIQAVVEESGVEIQDLIPDEQARIGFFLYEAGLRAYFAGVDLPSTLAQGYAPAMHALRTCLARYKPA